VRMEASYPAPRDGIALPACCLWISPSTLIQKFARSLCPPSAAARALFRATVARLRSVRVDYVAGERWLVGTIGDDRRLVDYRVRQGRPVPGRIQWKARSVTNATKPRPIRIGITIGGTIQAPITLVLPRPFPADPTLPQWSAPSASSLPQNV